MAITTTGDIKAEVLVRLNQSSTQAYYTDAILDAWLDTAHRSAGSYQKWPALEYMDSSILFVAGTENYSYPTNFQTNSLRWVKDAAGELYQKTVYRDYLQYRKDNASGTDKIFASFGRTFYINPQAASGTLYSFGMITPNAFDKTDPTSVTIFSNSDEMGNEAIVELMLAYAAMRNKDQKEHDARVLLAKKILDDLWTSMKVEDQNTQTKDHPMFKRFNVERGVLSEDLLKRDQFY